MSEKNEVKEVKEVREAVKEVNEEIKAEAKADNKKNELLLSESGSVLEMIKTPEQKVAVIGRLMQTGYLPSRFKSPHEVIAAMEYGIALGLNPFLALRQIANIKGTPSIFGDLPLAKIYSDGNLESITEFFIDAEGKQICFKNLNLTAEVFGAVCIVKRKGDLGYHETYFTRDEAKKAGLLGGDTWNKYTKTMLKYRARSMALKDRFPDSLNGIAIAEYDHNILPASDGNVVEVEGMVVESNDGKKVANLDDIL